MLRLDGDNKTKMTNVITLQPMAICSITSRYCVDTLSGRRLCRFRPVGIGSNPMTAPNLRASQTCFFFFLFVAVALLRFGPTKKFGGGPGPAERKAAGKLDRRRFRRPDAAALADWPFHSSAVWRPNTNLRPVSSISIKTFGAASRCGRCLLGDHQMARR